MSEVDGKAINSPAAWHAATAALRRSLSDTSSKIKLVIGNGIDPQQISSPSDLVIEYRDAIERRHGVVETLLSPAPPSAMDAYQMLLRFESSAFSGTVFRQLQGSGAISGAARTRLQSLLTDLEQSLEVLHSGSPVDHREFLRYQWRTHEYYRTRTSNQLPVPDYAYLAWLCRNKLADVVVTTNYDRYWNSIFEKDAISYAQNPCVAPGEWNFDGFCTDAASRSGDVTLWKVHGDLQFAVFRGCGHVFRLPEFIVDYLIPTEEIAKLWLVHHYRGQRYRTLGCPRCDERHHSLPYVASKDPEAVFGVHHLIDFVIDRRLSSYFEGVLSAVEKEIAAWDVPDVVVVAGFRGENEWLTPLLVPLASRIPVIHLLAAEPRAVFPPNEFPILNGLVGQPFGYPIVERTSGGLFHELIYKLLQDAGISSTTLTGEHSRWQSLDLWVGSVIRR